MNTDKPIQFTSDSFVTITCGACAHTADWEEFTRSPITGPLPPRTYQCPWCRAAWTIEPKGQGTHTPTGHYIPPPNQITRIPAAL
jgi:hypothetical protein